MPKDYVTPNVNDDLQDRMQSITQQILSRTRLLHIINQLNLYAGRHSQPSPDQKVDRMRKDIDIELVRDARNQITAFNVSYSSSDPHLAQQVTSELTNLFINENLEDSAAAVGRHYEVSREPTRRLRARFCPTRKIRFASSKRNIPGELPAQVGSNLQILAGLQSQLQTEEGRAECGETTARVSGNISESISFAAGYAEDCGRRAREVCRQ